MLVDTVIYSSWSCVIYNLLCVKKYHKLTTHYSYSHRPHLSNKALEYKKHNQLYNSVSYLL